MLNTYRLIHRELGGASFDLDAISEVLTRYFQASSSGAVGADALARSQNVDRSRDRLYNQSKMYTELFRMLGWMRPMGRRLQFQTTLLGDLLAEDWLERNDLVDGLMRESLLGITFPNPTTNNVGVVNSRPFRWLLLLAAELGGSITRHEMILGLLGVVDDLRDGAFQAAVDSIVSVRGSTDRLEAALAAAAEASNIQLNTLENYTRFPVGVLSSERIGWGTSESVEGIYETRTRAVTLTALGRATAEWLVDAIDVREASIERYGIDERAAFANYGYFAMLVRAGLDETEVEADLVGARAGAQTILADLGITGPSTFLYSPLQQAADDVIAATAGTEGATGA